MDLLILVTIHSITCRKGTVWRSWRIQINFKENWTSCHSFRTMSKFFAYDSSWPIFQLAQWIPLCWGWTGKGCVQRRWWITTRVSNSWRSCSLLSSWHCFVGHRMQYESDTGRLHKCGKIPWMDRRANALEVFGQQELQILIRRGFEIFKCFC